MGVVIWAWREFKEAVVGFFNNIMDHKKMSPPGTLLTRQ
jgi:hypothetical protein